MQKTLLVLLLFFGIGNGALQGQNHVHFLLFGGFSSSRLLTDLNKKEILRSEALNNYHLGAGFRFELGKSFYLQPEVYFARKGGIENRLYNDGVDTLSQNLKCISIDAPVLIGFRLFSSDHFCTRLYGGPVLSFLYDPDYEFLKNGIKETFQERSKMISAQAGLGFDLRFVTIDVRYEWGLSNLAQWHDLKTRNRILYITLGFKLF